MVCALLDVGKVLVLGFFHINVTQCRFILFGGVIDWLSESP